MHAGKRYRQQSGPKTRAWVAAAITWEEGKRSVEAVARKYANDTSSIKTVDALNDEASPAIKAAQKAQRTAEAYGKRSEALAGEKEAKARELEKAVMDLWGPLDPNSGVTFVKAATGRIKEKDAHGRFSDASATSLSCGSNSRRGKSRSCQSERKSSAIASTYRCYCICTDC